jgi:hypothetical protein
MCMGFKARKGCVPLWPAPKAADMPRPSDAAAAPQRDFGNYTAMQEIVEQTIFRSPRGRGLGAGGYGVTDT